MFRTQKFYMCKDCGNIIGVINNTGIPMYCCRKEMDELTPNIVNSENSNIYKKNDFQNTTELKKEGHNNANFDIFKAQKDKDGNEVSIIVDKSYLTPNSICWAYLNTKKGGQRKNILVDDFPVVNFKVVDDEIISAYFYCSDHGLFKWNFNTK